MGDIDILKLLICGKGGCGKSTVATLLAAAMQRRGKRIFLVDGEGGACPMGNLFRLLFSSLHFEL